MLGILSTLLLLGQEIENSFHIPSYEQRTPSVVFSSSLYPISQEESHIFDDFTSEGLVLFDMETNEVLYSKSAYLSLPIASLTKLVTAGVILENYEDLSQIVTTPELPSDHVFGMSVGMQRGLQFTLYQLLKAALIQSGNDAAYTLAIAHSENLDIFIEEMNSFVRSLGIRSQLFNNSTGLPVSGVWENMLAPIDFIRIVQKLWQYDVIRSFSQTREASFSDVQHNIHKTIRSTNKLLGGYKYSVLGLKTGTTNAAWECLITVFRDHDREYLLIMLGSEDRYEETIQVMDAVRSLN